MDLLDGCLLWDARSLVNERGGTAETREGGKTFLFDPLDRRGRRGTLSPT